MTTTQCAFVGPAESTSMLQWVFSRNYARLTCEVDADARGGYEVSVVPHWDVSCAAVEHYKDAADAFLRHAELTEYLRDTGWHLDRRCKSHAIHVA